MTRREARLKHVAEFTKLENFAIICKDACIRAGAPELGWHAWAKFSTAEHSSSTLPHDPKDRSADEWADQVELERRAFALLPEIFEAMRTTSARERLQRELAAANADVDKMIADVLLQRRDE